jgi:hypothetical protein
VWEVRITDEQGKMVCISRCRSRSSRRLRRRIVNTRTTTPPSGQATRASTRSGNCKLAQKNHPDVSKDPKSEEKFKEIAEAYQTLKDPGAA